MSQNEIEFASRLMILPGLLIAGGVVVMVAAILRGAKIAELRHRERMAMIERGLTPPEPVLGEGGPQRAQSFKTTLGIILCGLGAALFLLIGFTAEELGVATGVGGAFVAVGLAFMASAVVAREPHMGGSPPFAARPYDPSRRPAPPPAPPPVPPVE